MRIEYTLTYRDLLLFNLTHQFFSPVVQIFLAGPAVILGISVGEDHSKAVVVVAAILAYLLIWLLQIVFLAIFVASSGKNQSLLTAHIIELQEDALYDATEYSRSYHYWHGINKVVLRPGFTAIYTSAHVAHIVPRRAFASNDQVWQFVATIRERLRAGRK